MSDQSVNAFVKVPGGWQQYAIMSLADFEAGMERGIAATGRGRTIATDCVTGKVVAWSDEKDAPKGDR